jgi:hypothetical protein
MIFNDITNLFPGETLQDFISAPELTFRRLMKKIFPLPRKPRRIAEQEALEREKRAIESYEAKKFSKGDSRMVRLRPVSYKEPDSDDDDFIEFLGTRRNKSTSRSSQCLNASFI